MSRAGGDRQLRTRCSSRDWWSVLTSYPEAETEGGRTSAGPCGPFLVLGAKGQEILRVSPFPSLCGDVGGDGQAAAAPAEPGQGRPADDLATSADLLGALGADPAGTTAGAAGCVALPQPAGAERAALLLPGRHRRGGPVTTACWPSP